MSDSEVPPAKKAKLEDDAQNSQDSQTYGLHVTPEEVDRLREFQVLDEVKSDDEDSNDEGSDKSESSEELPEEEIEKMLEEDLPDGFKGAPKPKEKKYVKRQKIILEEKGINYFEVLPLDWLMVRHCSGMPLYMHRATRVCTLAKPYCLGKGNTRRHDIPISAIPCLAYRIALKEEQKQMEIDKKIAEEIKNGTWTDTNKPTDKTNENAESSKKPNEESGQKPECNGVKAKCPFSHLVQSKESENGHDRQKESGNGHVSAGLEQIDSSLNSEMDNAAGSLPVDKYAQNHSFSNHVHTSKDSPMEENHVQNPEEINTKDLEVVNREHSKSHLDSQDSEETNTKDSPSVLNHKQNKSYLDSQDPEETNTKDPLLVVNREQSKFHLDNPGAKDPSSVLNLSEQSKSHLDSQDPEETNDSPSLVNLSKFQVVNCEQSKSHLDSSVSEDPSSAVNLGEHSKSHLDSPGARAVVLPGGLVMPPPRVETVSTSWKSQQLTAEEVNNYCKKLFKFKEVLIMHFKRWADRRKYTKARKTMQYPTLPEGTKLITIPAQDSGDQNGGGKTAKRDWVMNMNGCSYLSVFHEYVRRALHKQPVYEFKQLENATAPYQATVYIGGMQYGVGRGSSKRQAKSQAARASIHILIPEMREELPTSPADLKLSKDDPDFTFFDYVTIEDPRIQEFCGAAAEPSPHAILRTCLLRNFGAGDRHIHTEMKKLEFQKIELTMKVGKHSATVVCKNKKQAKQRASQHILQQLHPHITSWGSLLRLYGSRSVKSCKEKKLEEQQITLLQDKARHNEPNHAVLEKLRNEMSKLKERDNAVVPIGTLLVSEDLPTHSGSNLNNVDL